MTTEKLWTGFDNTKIMAERAVCDEVGQNIVDTYATKAEVTEKLLSDYNTEGKKLQTELTAGDNVTIANNVISSNQVFVATYGTTTYAEVKAEYDAGKICTVFKDMRYYYIKWIDSASIMFETSDGKNTVYSLTVFSSDRWSTYTGQFATKEYVDSMLGNVEQLLSEL